MPHLERNPQHIDRDRPARSAHHKPRLLDEVYGPELTAGRREEAGTYHHIRPGQRFIPPRSCANLNWLRGPDKAVSSYLGPTWVVSPLPMSNVRFVERRWVWADVGTWPRGSIHAARQQGEPKENSGSAPVPRVAP